MMKSVFVRRTLERKLKLGELSPSLYIQCKKNGMHDREIQEITGMYNNKFTAWKRSNGLLIKEDMK